MTPSPSGADLHVVLVGGGHSHVQVLRRFIMDRPSGLRVTVVLDTPIAVYSGMVPGFVAGQYSAADLEIDVVPLARRAGAEVVLAAATGVDPHNRRVEIEGRPPIAYDLASFDIGSTVVGLSLPGVREHAVPTRPIGPLVARVDTLVEKASALPEAPRVAVVGGGAGGVELAFTLEARLRSLGKPPEVVLIHAGDRLLAGFPPGLGRRAMARCGDRGIAVRAGTRVASAGPEGLELDSGESLECDFLIWVAGATSHGLLRDSGLPTDDRGFVLTRPTLQVEGFDDLLAVGDCATLAEHPETPKAGVYAVRQGPYLTDNLLALAAGGSLRRYRPQRDFLTLLNTGDGRALGAKWGLSFEGRWVMRLKDSIDRKFMRLFQVLDSGGAELEEFARMPPMAGVDDMVCGGCAAKLGQEPLERALARVTLSTDDQSVVFGPGESEDVTAWRAPDGTIVASNLDVLRSFCDDPYLVGRVAAVNASSDLLAKGARPRYAQAVVSVPETLDDPAREEFLFQTLAGAQVAFDEIGVSVLGGHTLTAADASVGFAVDGVAGPKGLLAKAGAMPGHVLVLTKPLGTGVVLFADRRGKVAGSWLQAAHSAMVTSNRLASEAALDLGASAATDITGFGLAGHLGDLLRASGRSARVELSSLPALPGALELLRRGHRSTFHPENRRAIRAIAVEAAAASHGALELLFDPQTSGGLLIALPEARGRELVERVREATGQEAAVIGRVFETEGSDLVTVGA